MITGETISIQIGGAIAETGVFSHMTHCKITCVTEKAVQINGQWFPKKAFVQGTFQGELSDWYKLAKWFEPNRWQWAALEKTSNVGGQSRH